MSDILEVFSIEKYQENLKKIDPIKYVGTVIKVTSDRVVAHGPITVIGEVCRIILSDESHILAEVVGLDGEKVTLSCYDEMEGIEIGCKVVATGEELSVYVGDHLLGRVLDGKGEEYDDEGGIGSEIRKSVFNPPSDALTRKRIEEPLITGIKVIDGLITIGKGQRIGIFAGSGVGKSTLLGMIARNTRADVNVIALIGERGRELKAFIEDDLGQEGLERSVIIFSTSNKPALSRIRAAFIATTIAEYFRDTGKDVLLMMDSLTRFAQAQREIGLAAGEPPTTKGYPPSVFTMFPKLLERAGTSDKGSITGIYTVLVEGDDMDEPVSDTVRGILDGHIVLSRALAHRNHYPAIDVLASISRLMIKIVPETHSQYAGFIKELLAEYKDNEEAINLGVYVPGSNPRVDAARLFKPHIDAFLKQRIDEGFSYEETLGALTALIELMTQGGEPEEEEEDLLFNV